MNRLIALLATSLLLSACGQTIHRIALAPEVNSCQLTEQRSFLMTAGIAVCWNEKGQALGMGVTSGKPIAGVVGDAALAGGILGAGIAVGAGVKGVANVEVTVP